MDKNENLMVVENNVNYEILGELKKQNRLAKIQCLLTFIVVICCAGIIYLAMGLAGDIQSAAQNLGNVLAGMDIESLNAAIRELASLDLSGLNSSIGELSNLDLESLNQGISNFASFDFETLNKAIADLATVIEPMAKLTSIWR